MEANRFITVRNAIRLITVNTNRTRPYYRPDLLARIRRADISRLVPTPSPARLSLTFLTPYRDQKTAAHGAVTNFFYLEFIHTTAENHEADLFPSRSKRTLSFVVRLLLEVLSSAFSTCARIF